MGYGNVKIRQLMGGRKQIRFVFYMYGDPIEETELVFDGISIPRFKLISTSEEMENGDIKNINHGFRFSSKVQIYNIKTGDELLVMSLNALLAAVSRGEGEVYLFPYYDPTYWANSQNKYKVYESGDRDVGYMHEYLPDCQVFEYNFEEISINSGYIKRVVLIPSFATPDSPSSDPSGYHQVIL
jgi:hypothetical protein